MSQLSKQHIEIGHDRKTMFVNHFLDSITTDLKWEILETHYGSEFIEDEFQEWLSKNYHD